MGEKKRKVCPTCGGIGEIGYFQGESRFFITREECPNCCGCGYIEEENEETLQEKPENSSKEEDD